MDATVSNLRIEIGASSDAARREINKVTNALQSLRSNSNHKISVDSKDVDSANKKVGALSNILSSLKRIAFYRAIRSAIKAVSKAFMEGAENAYWFSKAVGGEIGYLYKDLTSLSSAGYKMSNQLGASFATLLSTVTPILIQITELITKAADAVTQFFAALGGKTVYAKAIDYTKEWAKQTGHGAKAAKEWKNQLLKFDEINRLEEPSNGNGGSGSTLPDYENMFEEAEVDSFFIHISEKFKELKESLDFTPLTASWDLLKAKVQEFSAIVISVLGWAWDNILVPVSKWTVEKALPSTIRVLASAFGLLNVSLTLLKPVALAVWENFLKPIAKWTADTTISVLDTLSEKLDALSSYLSTFQDMSFEESWNKLFGDLKNLIINTSWSDLADKLYAGVRYAIAMGIGKVVENMGRINFSLMADKFFECLGAAFGGALIFLDRLSWDIAEALHQHMVDIFDKNKDGSISFSEIGEAIAQGIFDGMDLVLNKIGGWIIDHIFKPIYEGIKSAFGIKSPSKEMKPIGQSIITGMLNGILEGIKSIPKWIKDHIFTPFIEAVVSAFGIAENIASNVKEYGENIWNGVLAGIDNAIKTVDQWVKSNIWEPFKSGLLNIFGVDAANVRMFSFGVNIITGLKNGIVQGLTGIGDWIYNTIWNPIVSGLNSIVDSINAWWSDVTSFFSSASSEIQKVINRGNNYDINKDPNGYAVYASGGFPEDGLFYANHGEMVGQFSNGKTAVANNEQITSGIATAVYEAFMDAFTQTRGNGSDGTPVNIYLDGREIARTTTRYQNQMARAGAY